MQLHIKHTANFDMLCVCSVLTKDLLSFIEFTNTKGWVLSRCYFHLFNK